MGSGGQRMGVESVLRDVRLRGEQNVKAKDSAERAGKEAAEKRKQKGLKGAGVKTLEGGRRAAFKAKGGGGAGLEALEKLDLYNTQIRGAPGREEY